MKCVFQEIFDFKLSFLNWKASSLFPPSRRRDAEQEARPNTKIVVALSNAGYFSRHKKVVSEVALNTE